MIDQGFMNPSQYKDRRRDLRKNPTETEKILWQHLKNNSLGIKFSRQVGIGTFIVDFCCRSQKIIIEVDGEIHEDKDNLECDKLREEILQSSGYKIIRFKNKEVLKNIEKVLEKIKSHLNPLPALGEGQGWGYYDHHITR